MCQSLFINLNLRVTKDEIFNYLRAKKEKKFLHFYDKNLIVIQVNAHRRKTKKYEKERKKERQDEGKKERERER